MSTSQFSSRKRCFAAIILLVILSLVSLAEGFDLRAAIDDFKGDLAQKLKDKVQTEIKKKFEQVKEEITPVGKAIEKKVHSVLLHGDRLHGTDDEQEDAELSLTSHLLSLIEWDVPRAPVLTDTGETADDMEAQGKKTEPALIAENIDAARPSTTRTSSHSVRPAASALPIVLMHGMGDAAENDGMKSLQKTISEHLSGAYVVSIQIGKDRDADQHNSYFMKMPDQVQAFADIVRKDPKLAKGFNAIGLSQGNLIIRGYLEQVNSPPISTFLSIHGPMAGVAEMPRCKSGDSMCESVSKFLGSFAYSSWVQNNIAQANYFRDPTRIPQYIEKCLFLPDLNNEKKAKNETYESNFLSLERLVLVMAGNDTTVVPKESEWFGAFADGNFSKILGLNETRWFTDNLFGLKTLQQQNKLSLETTNGDHLQFDKSALLSWLDKYFKGPERGEGEESTSLDTLLGDEHSSVGQKGGESTESHGLSFVTKDADIAAVE